MTASAVAHRPRHAAPARPSRSVDARALAGRLARGLRRAVAAALLLLLLGVAATIWLLHLGLSPVLTASMRPTYAPGDAVLTRTIPVSSLRPGDIAVFVPPGEAAPFAHRVVSITGDPHHPVIRTKGDANPAPDSWHATLPGPNVRVVVWSVPKIGYPLTWVKTREARAALIGVVGLLLTLTATRTALRRT
jgi:signal peptidase